MPRSAGQKLKLLYLLRLLSEEGSEEKPVTVGRMIEYLDAQGIGAERKSIYDDMEKLRDFGIDVIKNGNRTGGGYFLGTRDFELPELKLLVDAVQSSRFITTKKTRELIEKLERIAGKQDAGKLQREVHVVGRAKTENEGIYYSVDSIHRGMQENRQIAFVYMDWNANKEMVPRSEKERIVSPWALLWNNENYYLIAYDGQSEAVRHFRVDKMGNVHVLEKERLGAEAFGKIDLASYSNQTFGMFGGREELVTLSLPLHMAGVVIDRFGKEVALRKMADGTIRVRTKLAVSGQFFGWLAGLGKDAKVLSPDSVRQEYRSYLEEILRDGFD
ncbi:MAG: WYL domain-containing protein [Lachnospiraceae bacterium]|nr:WYL domain-containing protein [Lachnospiraceae bacterium]